MELHTNREEILAKHCKYGVEFIKDSEPINMDQSEVFPAMDEYSRLVACEFTKWVCFLNHETKTTEQLFDEFIKEYGK